MLLLFSAKYKNDLTEAFYIICNTGLFLCFDSNFKDNLSMFQKSIFQTTIDVIFLYSKFVKAYMKNEKKDIRFFYAGQSLLEDFTFRVSVNHKFGITELLHQNKLLILKLFRKKDDLKSGKPIGLFCENIDQLHRFRHMDYLSQNAGIKIDTILTRDDIIYRTSYSFLLFSIFLMIAYIPFYIYLTLRKIRPDNAVLLITEIFEASFLLYQVKILSINTVYFFDAYQIDTNSISLTFIQKKIDIYTVFDIVPLASHNRNVVSNHAIFCNPYHEEEYTHNKDHILLNDFTFWVPLSIVEYKLRSHRYNTKLTNENTIGLYSHAAWLRREWGRPDSHIGDIESEMNLISVLDEIVASLHAKILIFLHPIEKENYEHNNVYKYYENEFPTCNWEIFDRNKNPFDNFSYINTGLGCYTSILHERLMCGYKTVFYTSKIKNGFPIEDSSLFRISANNPVRLRTLLQKIIPIETNFYYNKFNLNKYKKYNLNTVK